MRTCQLVLARDLLACGVKDLFSCSSGTLRFNCVVATERLQLLFDGSGALSSTSFMSLDGHWKAEASTSAKVKRPLLTSKFNINTHYVLRSVETEVITLR